MKIALIIYPSMAQHASDVAAFLATSHLQEPIFEGWMLDSLPGHAEQLLDALETQWQKTPVDLLLFPADALGDELATRLAWRINAGSVCQAIHWNEITHSATKASWGNALLATLSCPQGPVCLSVARRAARGGTSALPSFTQTRTLATASLPPALCLLLQSVYEGDAPLVRADRVLAFGQGGADGIAENTLANALNAEVGFTRQRVMLGGCDESRMIGVSGVLLAPELCIVAGASGAAAFSAGIRQSQFIVAINHSPDAPVFSQADVGIVADWQPALQALAQLYCKAVS